ncbi:MAG: PRD domain-containing protein [Selenomonadaceae bacterium]|nr:PRD domain-containing protein [Selenomonadaceae bacterium]
MEQRTRDILKLLLQENSFQTITDIATKLSISGKTVSRQLPKVEDTLKSVGLSLEKKSGAGIKVVGSEVKRYALSKQIKSGEKNEYTPAERRSIIISKLLSSHEPIKLFALSSAVHVTDSTISNDLDKLESWFRNQGLKLLRKPGLGVSLLGDERDLRRAIVRYIYEHVGENRLMNLMQDNLPEEDNAPVAKVPKFLLGLIDSGEWRRLEQMIRVMENDLGYKLSDNAFIGLLVHMSLSIHRIKNHEPITIDDKTCAEIRGTKEFSAAKRLAEKISEATKSEVPDSEICYVTMHILGARSRLNSAGIGKISMMDNFRLITLARKIMKQAAKITGRDIDKNKTLLAGLINHLAPSISRMKMNMDIRNPLLDEIRVHYPELMSLTRKCVGELEQEVGRTLPDSEIAYIAMHLGAALSDSEKFVHAIHRVVVACPTGMGTSRLLSSRLRATFPTIKVVDEIPILEVNSEYIAAKDFEFIISTMPIARADCPVVVVGAALTQDDCKKIDAELSRQNRQFLGSAEEIEPRPPFMDALIKMTAYGNAIQSLMTNYFYVRGNVSDINSACKLAGNLAGKDAESSAEISKALLMREDKGSTLIVGRRMILLHCKSSAVKAPAFGILQLGEGFIYPEDGERIRTAIVLLAPDDADEFTLETIGHIASVLPDCWGFIELLHEGNSSEIHGEVLKIFEDFYKSKVKELI